MSEATAVEVAEDEDGPLFKYKVPLKAVMTGVVYVVARNEAEAEEKAFDEMPELCINCSGFSDHEPYYFELNDAETDGEVEEGDEAEDESDWKWEE